ncbi:MAG: imelysin family protein [bacterium]|nr:imelysin family protein [bacterium]
MKTLKFILPAMGVLCLSACSDSNVDTPDEMTQKEQTLKAITIDYVENNVRKTYAAMADASIELLSLCETMQEKHTAGTLATAHIQAAGEAWKRARKSWELSEAFLFGPAANHNIDPHIDSWPLDKAAMDNLLTQIRNGNKWSLENNGGYGLIGFHSIEYMLFELSADGNTSQVHSTNYTPEEMEYLVAVATDLCQQCVCLEACWAGTEYISLEKQQILQDADLDYGENYGWEMMNAGQAGSRFKTYQEAVEEIIQGCIDIADEVGNTKIGRPHIGSSDADKNYIESPYSLNSIEDFIDNIYSIRNSYLGTGNASVSISAYVKSVSPETDTEVRNAINNAIAAIEVIPEPFAKTASGPLAEAAMEAAGTTLVSALEKANRIISNN